jgi:hypothetical protein
MRIVLPNNAAVKVVSVRTVRHKPKAGVARATTEARKAQSRLTKSGCSELKAAKGGKCPCNEGLTVGQVVLAFSNGCGVRRQCWKKGLRDESKVTIMEDANQR